jgi:two-component sensor histidine kinase
MSTSQVLRPRAPDIRSAPPATRRAAATSRFAQMATGAALVSVPRQALLGILLDATLPFTCRGSTALRPLWANEAMLRAYDLITLVTALERQLPCHAQDALALGLERAVAVELAGAFRSLDISDDAEEATCSELLRTVLRDLVELFGPVPGELHLLTAIEQLSLPAFKRRALVLLACDLLVGALRHGRARQAGGRIGVTLHRGEDGRAGLDIIGDGLNLPGHGEARPDETLCDLAALLEGELVHHVAADGRLFAKVAFPA